MKLLHMENRIERKVVASLRLQWQRNRYLLGSAALIVACCVTVVWLAARLWHIDPIILLRDVYIVVGAEPYAGLMSNIGLLGWCVAATVWSITVYLLHPHRADPRYGLAISAGVITAILLIDDGWMLHEYLLPQLTGLSEKVFLAGYALLAITFAGYALPRMLQTDYLLAGIAAGCLAASYLIDIVLPFTPRHTLYEDVAKLSGIIFWAAYALSVFREVAKTQRGRLA
ncbi:MAG TPA: hypothetical protein DEF43_12905 [Chloroflexus aurantiacus]|jgi:hypothetical protein|uniref:Uncharacterized protein n=1 Tax=Chloroflexus aurantiacus (strain ATCC 29366 / DSM 635 / J-10-fl) TaxID=324602 RepID=A9WBV1_CHLAA|nr:MULTISPECIES: hypothetical protein [Chloroflexus]ABY36903.1 hypothetical protein Caur_3725 [Chloroflexus aurantiacus J-10-fl]RMG50591.1 MAG: hypothetical protein D6716_08125 [Chloroflexota bacterium]GIV93345.1 MAG: hypothetical protein KatS3mg056_2054 [Chloroflexus sp.]HBW68036.1 hypothetical protein [Chloroflexus aurantiacus]